MLFQHYADSHGLRVSTLGATIKHLLRAIDNRTFIRKLTGTSKQELHVERFLFCAVDYLTGNRPALRFQLSDAISEYDYDLILHYNKEPRTNLAKRLNKKPGTLYVRYARACSIVENALHDIDQGASDVYIQYWYNLSPQRISKIQNSHQPVSRDNCLQTDQFIYQLLDELHLFSTTPTRSYLFDALTLSLQNPHILECGEVWQQVADKHGVPVSLLTSKLNQKLKYMKSNELFQRLFGLPNDSHLHYATLTAALYWYITGERILFNYRAHHVITQIDYQCLTDLYETPMSISKYAKTLGVNPSSVHHRVNYLWHTLSSFHQDWKDYNRPNRYLLYKYGLNDERLDFIKRLLNEMQQAKYGYNLAKFLSNARE